MHKIPNTSVGQLIKSGRKTAIAAQLNLALALSCDLALSYRHARWNVTGGNFTELQGLFGALAAEGHELADTIAERIAALDGAPEATIQAVFDRTNLDPLALGVRHQGDLLDVLASRAVWVADWLRAAADRTTVDPPTRQLYVDALSLIERQRRRLVAHMERESYEIASVAA